MERKTKMTIAVVIVVAIVVTSTVLFFNLPETGKLVGIVNVPLNKIDITTNELIKGYILDNETYDDTPASWQGREALETRSLTYSSIVNFTNDTIDIWLKRLNSSFDAQKELYDLIRGQWGVSSFMDEIYSEPYEQIGDESILKSYFSNGESSTLNKTSIILYFRVKNIAGYVQRSVGNFNTDYNEFMHSEVYKNYCTEVWKYANAVEGRIDSHIVFIKGEEPSGKVLELKEIRSKSSGKTVVMSAEEYMDDLLKSNISGFRGMFSFHVLNAGDTLTLRDNISATEYEPVYNDTFVSLKSSYWRPLNLFIQGNITGKYIVGDKVEISLHIIEVNFSYLGNDYSVKIIAEGWKNLNYYLYYQTIIDTIDIVLSQSYIQKV